MRGIDLPRTRDKVVTRRSSRCVGVQQRLRCSLFCEITITRWTRTLVGNEGGFERSSIFGNVFEGVKSRDLEIGSVIGRIFVGFVMILAI